VNNDAKPLRNYYVMLREEFDDWAVLFDPDTGHGFGLNPMGVYLWKLLDGNHSIDALVEALRRDARDVPEEAARHMVAFVEGLAEYNLAGYETEEAHHDRGGPSVHSTRVFRTHRGEQKRKAFGRAIQLALPGND
jgi:SynChlorMet cassette protein ScmD